MRQGKKKKKKNRKGGACKPAPGLRLARARTCTHELARGNGSLLKAGFYSFQMAVDLNATEGHSVKCSRIAPLPATEQRLTAG